MRHFAAAVPLHEWCSVSCAFAFHFELEMNGRLSRNLEGTLDSGRSLARVEMREGTIGRRPIFSSSLLWSLWKLLVSVRCSSTPHHTTRIRDSDT